MNTIKKQDNILKILINNDQEEMRAPQEAQWVKNPIAMPETRVQSPGRDNPLEEGKATYSSILAWRIPWTEEPGSYSP